MPEPSVLFTVTAVVVASLLVWVGVVLSRANTPWPRTPSVASMAALPDEPPLVGAPSSADATAEATAVVVADAPASTTKATDEAGKAGADEAHGEPSGASESPASEGKKSDA